MSYEDDDEWEEKEAAERYGFLDNWKDEPSESLRDQLEPKYQKVLDSERAKLAARMNVAEEHGEDYHNIDEFTDENASASQLPLFQQSVSR